MAKYNQLPQALLSNENNAFQCSNGCKFLAVAQLSTPIFKQTSSCRGNTGLHMIGKVPQILGAKHV